MTLKDAISQHRLSYRRFALEVGMSPAALSRLLNYGEYPARRDRGDVITAIHSALAKHGIDARAIEIPRRAVAPEAAQPSAPAEADSLSTEDIDLMQLSREVLNLFGLRQNPFLNDVENDEDVFRYKGHNQVEQAIREAIEQRGFIAVASPSGAGKTTIWDGIESEFCAREDTVICKPQIKGKEKLTPEHLVRALIYGLCGEDVKVQRDAEDRGRQLSIALRNIKHSTMERKAVLYIDDAHFCSASVLRQLKTFYEEKIGRYRLLAIVLVGLPVLKNKLAAFPEIGNRIRLVEVPPVPVRDYLDFKLRRAGVSIDKLFDQGGLEAFLDRFRLPKRQALGYPLEINSLCIRAMVKLFDNGAQPGEKIGREIIDRLPGERAERRAA